MGEDVREPRLTFSSAEDMRLQERRLRTHVAVRSSVETALETGALIER
jgi:hypothetical protein